MTTANTLTWELPQEHHRQLAIARAEDKTPATDRLRAIVRLWSTDQDLRGRIDTRCGELRHTPKNPAGGDVKLSVSFDGPELPRALALARSDDGITTSERIRAALDLWTTDEQFRSAVDQEARRLRAGRRTHTPPRSG